MLEGAASLNNLINASWVTIKEVVQWAEVKKSNFINWNFICEFFGVKVFFLLFVLSDKKLSNYKDVENAYTSLIQ